MSRGAKQCREYLEDKYPGIRISRKSCRDTAGGSVSDHSAYRYGEYDSNAIDIMGPSLSWGYSYRETQAWLDIVYADIMGHYAEWSFRLVLWRVADHYGHIHCSFLPQCLEHKWCGRRIEPTWRLSDGTLIVTDDPDPENGPYDGPQPVPEPPVEEGQMPTLEIFTIYVRKVDIEKMGADGLITPNEVEYFTGSALWEDDDKKRDLDHPDWNNLYNAYRVRAPIWAV